MRSAVSRDAMLITAKLTSLPQNRGKSCKGFVSKWDMAAMKERDWAT